MPSKPYFPLYFSDFKKDTSRLTHEECYAYLLLLNDYWDTEKPLPNDKKVLEKVSNLDPKTFQKVWGKLKVYFELKDDGFLYHKRLDEEIEKWRKGASERSEKAKKAAQKRWENECSEQCSEHTSEQCLEVSSEVCLSQTQTQIQTSSSNSNSRKNTVEPMALVAQAAPARPPPVSGMVREIFDFWRQTLGHLHAQLTTKRQRLIAVALKTYPPDFLCQAIAGCSQSPWHMGENDRGMRYDDLTLILRSGEHIEKFHRLFVEPPVPRKAFTTMADQEAQLKAELARERAQREQKRREFAEKYGEGEIIDDWVETNE